MSPKRLMIVGITSGIAISILDMGGFHMLNNIVVAFASGALFGKGYGIWEVRSKND